MCSSMKLSLVLLSILSISLLITSEAQGTHFWHGSLSLVYKYLHIGFSPMHQWLQSIDVFNLA